MAAILIIAGNVLCEIIVLLILANIILSILVSMGVLRPDNAIVRFVYGLTEPMLAPLRRFLTFGMFDFSPWAVVLILQFIVFPLYRMLVLAIF